MSRIRSIKPEWLDDDIALASSDARVLSVALILLADDCGNGRASPRILAGRVFPGIDGSSRVLTDALDELQKIGFVELYDVAGQAYFNLPNWKKHQRIDRPSPGKVPPPTAAEAFPCPRDAPVTPDGLAAPPDVETQREGQPVDGDSQEPPRCRTAANGRPLPRKPEFPAMVLREDYTPCPVMTRWAEGLGLDEPRLDAVLRDLRDKHGLRPHTLDWWDERWLRFAETAVSGTHRVRGRIPTAEELFPDG